MQSWSDVRHILLMAAKWRWMADNHKEKILVSICRDQSFLRKDWTNLGRGNLLIAEGMQDEVG